MEGLRPQKIEDSPFNKKNNEDSLEPVDAEVVELPYLTTESLAKIFGLHELKISFTEQLSSEDLNSFMERVHDFDKKLKYKAKSGDLKYGDNVIGTGDLKKFALYSILIGENISPDSTWLDLEGNLIENFMRNGFKE